MSILCKSKNPTNFIICRVLVLFRTPDLNPAGFKPETFSDLGRIQTCNLLSRNQMRYSVAPRGLFNGVQIYFFLNLSQNL